MAAVLRALPPLLWLIAFPLEIAAWWFLRADDPVSLAGAVALHLIATLIFGPSLLTWRGRQLIWSWPLIGWTLAGLAFPVLGMAAVAVGFVVSRIAGLFRRPIAAELALVTDLNDRATDAIGRAHEIDVALLDELEIEPVVDVLREDDPELKRAAIEALTKQGGVDTVRLLMGLLHDPSPEARFFSSIGLSKLEDEISQTILAAQRTLAETPDSHQARHRLAALYLDYAVSGFLEGVTRDYYLELARQEYETVWQQGGDPAVTRELARVHLLLGNIAEAAALLDELARRQPGDLDAHLLRMDVIFQFQDFRELSYYANRTGAILAPTAPPGPEGNGAAERPDQDIDARALIAWWAGRDGQERRGERGGL